MSMKKPIRRGEQEERLSHDTIFSMLSNQRRRYVIHFIKRDPGPIRIRDLAQQVAAWENGIEVEELTYKQRKRVYTSLHQTHLPKLHDAGVVEYDRDRGTITLADGAAELDIYLDVVSENDIPWSDFYLGLSAVALALVVAAWVDIGPLAAIPDIAYAASLSLLFTAASIVHAYYTRRTQVGGTSSPVEAVRYAGARSEGDPTDNED
jgi:hypothetical protein